MNLIKALRLGIITFMATAAIAQAQTLSDGLVAFYPFNGNANDATGNGHDGVVLGAMLTTNRFGQPNSAYAFNGSTSLIVVSNSSDLQPFTDFSVSVWLEVPFFTNTFSVFFSKHLDSYNDSGWIMAVLNPPNGLPFQFASAPFFDVNDPQANMSSNIWVHGVFTYERSSGICKVYMNGVLADTRSRVYNTNADPRPFVMGAQPTLKITPTGYNYYFAGILDDIRIYNRVLSSSDVQQLYAELPKPVVNLSKAVRLGFSSLIVGKNYQLQVSQDLINWSNQGPAFTATGVTNSQYADIGDWNAGYWRLQVAP